MGLIHYSHPACAELFQDLIVGNCLADHLNSVIKFVLSILPEQDQSTDGLLSSSSYPLALIP